MVDTNEEIITLSRSALLELATRLRNLERAVGRVPSSRVTPGGFAPPFWAKLTATLSLGGSATALRCTWNGTTYIEGNEVITVYDTMSKVSGASGDFLFVHQSVFNGRIEPVSGSGGGVTLHQFEMTGAWSAGVANADITAADGTGTPLSTTINDPLLIFASLTTGDVGFCLLDSGSYYAIQAPCPAAGATSAVHSFLLAGM